MAIYDLMDLLQMKKDIERTQEVLYGGACEGGKMASRCEVIEKMIQLNTPRLTCKLCRKAHEAEKFYIICPDCVEEHKDCGKAFDVLLKANEMLAAELTSSGKKL